VEIQALTVPAKGGVSRVFSDGVESRRVSRMAAVLEKHVGLVISDQDIYVNVAGGLRIRDVGVELALAMAIYGARTDRSFPDAAVITGEVSLAGEVRPVPQMARRDRTARELGFTTCVGPAALRQSEAKEKRDWNGVGSLEEAIRLTFGS
jgi:DNA repair protein RadA/Sms